MRNIFFNTDWNCIALTLALALGLSGCREDELVGDDFAGDPEETVRITATVNATDQTRANVYIEEGEIDRGTFLLHYVRPNYTSTTYFAESFVDFGDPEGPNVGFAYTKNGSDKKDLKWKNIYNLGSSSLTFYLSNVDPDTYTESNSTTYKKLRFNKTLNGVTVNPYVAAPLDEEFGTNDLLIGSASAKNTTGKINFTLDHILALLKINVEVFAAKSDNWSVNLENARIFISNLCTTTGSVEYNSSYRKTFTYNTSTAPTYYTPYGGTYYNPKDVSLTDPAISRGWGKINDRKQVEGYEEPYFKTVYESQRFVFPPQSIPPSSIPAASTGYTGHPVLTVRVPKEDATGIQGEAGDSIDFSGPIPLIMFDGDADGNVNATSPQAIALNTGCQLTITASINSPETSLTFAPAKVEAWVSKSTFYIKTNQGGIYRASDFLALIDAYNRGDEEEMARYGYHNPDGDYVFQLWSSFKIDEDLIRGMMKPGENADGTVRPRFSFAFNSYALTLQHDNTDGETLADVEGQYELYNILTGEQTEFGGIRTSEQFLSIVRQIESPQDAVFADIIKYAWINNSDNTLNFEIRNSVDICIDELFYKFKTYKLWNYDLVFNIPAGKHIRIYMPEAPDVYFDINGDDEFDRLSRITVPPTYSGIISAGDFYFLLECYNKFYKYFPDLLKLYGSYNSSSGNWGMTYRSAMTIDGTRAYAGMVPDPDNDRPNYSFSGTNYSITFTHPLIPCTCVSFNTYPLVSGKGSTSTGTKTGSTATSTIVTAYKNNDYATLLDCGSFDPDNKKWTFVLSYSTNSTIQNVNYSAFFGQMLPDENEGRFDYEFELEKPLQVKGVEAPEEVGSTISDMVFYQDGDASYGYPNTAEDAKLMSTGRYWDRYPQWPMGKPASRTKISLKK